MTLHIDLQGCLREEKSERVIDHSAIFYPGYDEFQDNVVNDIYEDNCAKIEDARQRRDWLSFIDLNPERRRLGTFCQMVPQLECEEYSRLFAHAWCESNHVYVSERMVLKLLLGRPPLPDPFMQPGELEALRALPNDIVVYRGYGGTRPERQRGMSWTTNDGEAMRMA
jgi:hypothetical protein